MALSPTTFTARCFGRLADVAGWADVIHNFTDSHAQGPKAIQPTLLGIGTPVFMISRDEIAARGAANIQPLRLRGDIEWLDYVAASNVGFNAAKTKAIVYTTKGAVGDATHMLEQPEARWLSADLTFRCRGYIF